MSPKLNPWSGRQCLSSSPGLQLCSTQPLASKNLGPSFGPGHALSGLTGVLASVCLWPSLQPCWEGVAVFDDGRRGPAVTQWMAVDTQERPLCTEPFRPWLGRLAQLDMEQQTGFQIGNGVRQGCILSPCLFNLYAKYIMRNTGLDEAQAGIKIARRNINNFRYADDTTLMAESKELKSLLMKGKEESGKSWLKTQRSENLRSWHLVPSLHGK